jgi:hypothetical protein
MADHKPVPIDSSALIKVGGTNFFNMRSVRDLQAAMSEAPPESSVGLFGNIRMDTDVSSPVLKLNGTKKEFVKGASVFDKKKGKKATIILASAGYTKHSKVTVHRVADKKGDSWLAVETDLTLS